MVSIIKTPSQNKQLRTKRHNHTLFMFQALIGSSHQLSQRLKIYKTMNTLSMFQKII